MKSDNPLMRKLLSFLIALALIFGAAANSFAGSMMLLGAGSSTGGGGGGGSPVFVSPPYFSGATTYSNANRTVLITGASAGIQANTALTGKKVFSAHFDVLGGSDAILGIATIGGNTNIPGFDGNRSFGYYSSVGNIWLNSVNVANGVAWPIAGNQAGVAIDVPNSLAWVTMDGTNYYGSTGPLTATQVAAGTSGLSISVITAIGTIFPAVGSDAAGNQLTLQAYPWTIPSGFSQY
jgi:hypothetical protein